jgi:citrate synthase
VRPNRLIGFHRTGKDELMETAMALHDAAIKDEYFVKRQLAPNVDFWYVLQLAFLFQVAHFLS